jgi:hypothetical protein
LFCSGIFYDWQTKPARNPINLVTVDVTRLSGGAREISLDIEFDIEGDKKIRLGVKMRASLKEISR